MKKIIVFIVILLVLVGGFWVVTPRMTVSSINKAIVENDDKRLEELIDFNQLRQNIKAQIVSAMDDNLPKGKRKNALVDIAAKFTASAVDNIVDSVITPKGLAAFIDGRKYLSGKEKDKDYFKNASYSYNSYNSVTVWIENDNPERSRLVLQLSGISWKMVDIKIPLPDLK